MGLSESALKPFSFYHIVKYHVIAHVVLKFVGEIIIAFSTPIHTKTLSAIAMKNLEKQY